MKEKLPKCQEVPIISAWGRGVKYTSALALGGFYIKRIIVLSRLPTQEKVFRKLFFHSKMADFVLPLTLRSATFSD